MRSLMNVGISENIRMVSKTKGSRFSWVGSPFFLMALIGVAIAIGFACGDAYDEDDDYVASFFPPETTGDTAHSDFFYTPRALYESEHTDYYGKGFSEVNIQEWGEYFNNKVSEDDLNYILYAARPGEIDTLIFSIKKAGYPVSDTLKKNSILKIKESRAALDFLYYMGFAKRCEKYVTYEPVYWYDEENLAKDHRKDKAGMGILIEGGLKQITNTNSSFVQQRYVFQLIRLYYMSKQYDKCIQLYANQKSMLETNANSMKYRAMGYAAGAYYGSGQFSNADYLYSLLYDQSNIMRIDAYLSFHPQEENDWKQTMAMAKSNREKEVLWQMFGIYADAIRAMKEIYALDPKSDLMDLMLARAMNKQELRYQSDSLNRDLQIFIKIVADKGNTSKPYEWDLAAGYLGWTTADKDFQKYLNKAKAECNGDSLVLEEARLIELFNKLNEGKAGDKTFEQNIVPELKWVKNLNHTAYFPQKYAHHEILDLLRHKYLDIDDTLMAVCFTRSIDDEVLDDEFLLNKIETFIGKKNKTEFEQYACDEFKYSTRDLIDIQATLLLYKGSYKEAYSKLSEDDSAGSAELYGYDPLDIQINDCHECDAARDSDVDPIAASDTSSFHTKKEFVLRLVLLENSIKTDPKHLAENYFLMANALYNMTYFGNNRSLYESPGTGVVYQYFGFSQYTERVANTGELVNPLPINCNCSKAEEYYNKAMNSTKDPEFKAKCCFMAAKCEQNMFFLYKPSDYKGDFKAGKYFAMLKANYSKTKYYDEIINECGYFKTYLNSK